MSNWFRFYDDAVNDPKIIDLPDDLYRAWVNLLCIAAKNDGVLPEIKHVALVLRVKPQRAALLITRLVSAELIDNHDGIFAPHNWQARQFKSDDSGPRVKRHREKLRNIKRNAECNVTHEEERNALEEKENRIEGEQSTTDGRALDEIGLKNEKALGALFTALCQSLNRSTPDLRSITTWLLDGIAMGTISTTVTPIMKRKADMVSLGYCDAAVREAHARTTPANLQVVSRKVFVVEGTIEWNAQQRHARETTGRGTPVADERDADSRLTGRRGWYFESLVPEGYDEATGERIAPPENEENAA